MPQNVRHKTQTFSYLVFSIENGHLCSKAPRSTQQNSQKQIPRYQFFPFTMYNDKVEDYIKSLKVPEQILESPECLAGTVLHSSSYITCSGITRSTYFLPFLFFAQKSYFSQN